MEARKIDIAEEALKMAEKLKSAADDYLNKYPIPQEKEKGESEQEQEKEGKWAKFKKVKSGLKKLKKQVKDTFDPHNRQGEALQILKQAEIMRKMATENPEDTLSILKQIQGIYGIIHMQLPASGSDLKKSITDKGIDDNAIKIVAAITGVKEEGIRETVDISNSKSFGIDITEPLRGKSIREWLKEAREKIQPPSPSIHLENK